MGSQEISFRIVIRVQPGRLGNWISIHGMGRDLSLHSVQIRLSSTK
jgi:hypothetical protein